MSSAAPPPPSSRRQAIQGGRARPTRPARSRRRNRTWREHLQSENLRMLLSLPMGVVTGTALILLFPQTNYLLREQQDDQLFSLLLLVIVFLISYSAAFTVLTFLALHDQPRARLIALIEDPAELRRLAAAKEVRPETPPGMPIGSAGWLDMD